MNKVQKMASALGVVGLFSLGVAVMRPSTVQAFDFTEMVAPQSIDVFAPVISFVLNHYNAPFLQNDLNPLYSFRKIIAPSTQYVESTGTVEIKNVTREQLASFTSDTRNDVYWYPGVSSVVRTRGNGGTGTIYDETINFGGTNFTDQVYVAALVPGYLFVENSINGPIQSSGVLTYASTTDGAKLTLRGLIPVPQGFDPDQFRALLGQSNSVSFTSLANHFNSTATVTYSDKLITTPALQ